MTTPRRCSGLMVARVVTLMLLMLLVSLVRGTALVSAAADTLPPAIISPRLVVGLENAVAPGQSFTVTMRVTDDVSGVAAVRADFFWEDGRTNDAIGGIGQLIAGTPLDGLWVVTLTIPRSAAVGTLRAAALHAVDGVGNSRVITPPTFPLATWSIWVTYSRFDSTPPTVVSASLLQHTIDAGQPLIVTMHVTDDSAGVLLTETRFVWLSGGAVAFVDGTGRLVSGTPLDGIWEIQVPLPRSLATGTLHIAYLRAMDRAGNSRYPSVFDTPEWTVTVTNDGSSPIVNCTPRPPVAVTSTSIGNGQLQVNVHVSGDGNSVRGIVFGYARNGRVLDQPVIGGTAASFIVERTASGQVTIPFTVTDGCGNWPTFVGGGASAF